MLALRLQPATVTQGEYGVCPGATGQRDGIGLHNAAVFAVECLTVRDELGDAACPIGVQPLVSQVVPVALPAGIAGTGIGLCRPAR